MVIFIICTIIDQETLGPVVAGEAAAAELEKLQDRFVCLFVELKSFEILPLPDGIFSWRFSRHKS